MSRVRDIIRLHEIANMSVRQIARAVNVSRPVVNQYLKQAKAAGLRWADVEPMSDDKLLDRLQQVEQQRHDPRYTKLLTRLPHLVQELGKRRKDANYITRQVLWEEYRAECPDGYGYSQFCFHLQVYAGDLEISMHLDHVPGEKLFMDYAGKRPHLTDPKTGIEIPVELYVSVFPSGGLIYTEATRTQSTEDTIEATRHTMEYADGAPKILVPDNLKAAVTTPDRYDPEINAAFEAFSRYYGCVVIPARVRKPKDKALVEAAVHLVYTRVLAPMRNRTFATIDELNIAIWEHLDRLNDRLMQKIRISRRERFAMIEAERLRPLPVKPYITRLFTKPITVQKNYHLFFPEDKHYYSVPYRYRSLKAVISHTRRDIEIYHKNERIAFHPREYGAHQYTTNPDHMPTEHRFHSDLSAEKFLNWAGAIGPETRRVGGT